jgi:hypothetical protein
MCKDGKGYGGDTCTYCNGTGEPNPAALSHMKYHICQCIFLDRKNCPICGKACHHDTPHRPKIEIAPMH